MNRTSQVAFAASAITALVVVCTMAGISLAGPNSKEDASAAATKRAFTRAQTRELKKQINAALAKRVGPTGPTGAPGAAGAAGPAVAPAGYFAANASQIAMVSSAAHSLMVGKSLPAGKYIVNASVNMFYSGGSAGNAARGDCHIAAPGLPVQLIQDQASADNIGAELGPPGYLNFPLSATVDLASPASVEVRCTTTFETAFLGMFVQPGAARINAIAVGSVN